MGVKQVFLLLFLWFVHRNFGVNFLCSDTIVEIIICKNGLPSFLKCLYKIWTLKGRYPATCHQPRMHQDYEHHSYIRSPVNAARWTSGRVDGPSSSASKNMKDTSDWSNLKNQRLPNIVLIMITSSDYKTLNSSLQKPATWIVSSEKPSKLRCIQITLTEMGDSTSANPDSHYCINSRKTDSHQYNTVIPPAQHSFIPPPSSTTCCASTRPAPSGQSTSYWPCPFPATTLSSINTTHISTRVILPSPAYEDGTDREFRNVGF